MQMSRRMKLAEAKQYVANKLGGEILELTDEDVMYPLRQELAIGVATAGKTPAGTLAKCLIAELFEIEVNSVNLLKSMINR